MSELGIAGHFYNKYMDEDKLMERKKWDTIGPFQRGSVTQQLSNDALLDKTLQHAFNQGFHRAKIGVMRKLRTLPPGSQVAMFELIRDVLPGRHDAPLEEEHFDNGYPDDETPADIVEGQQ